MTQPRIPTRPRWTFVAAAVAWLAATVALAQDPTVPFTGQIGWMESGLGPLFVALTLLLALALGAAVLVAGIVRSRDRRSEQRGA